MISLEQRDKMLKIMGSKHISKINKYFIDQKIKNRDGAFYSTSFISQVFNGVTTKASNPTVEEGIFAAVEAYEVAQQEEQTRRNDILNNKTC